MTKFLTDFGDASVTIPIALAVALVLSAGRQWWPALGWSVAIGAVWVAMFALKLAGYVVASAFPGSPLAAIDLVTPSGHVAGASVVYGGLAGLALGRPGSVRARALAAAAVVAVAIGVTRVHLDEHSVSEALLGGTVGLAGVALLVRIVHGPVAGQLRLPVAVTAALILLVNHGTHLTFEKVIRQAAAAAIRTW